MTIETFILIVFNISVDSWCFSIFLFVYLSLKQYYYYIVFNFVVTGYFYR